MSQWNLRRNWRDQFQRLCRYRRLCLALPHNLQLCQPGPLVLPCRSPDLLDAK
jgi:hypothetical protein